MSIPQLLEEKIAAEGPISVADYMATCLYHPTLGYYMSRDPLGAEGDFITVPEMTQMFGELLGLWVADCWIKMGRPAPVQLVECGPGRGTLMLDVLRAISQVMPDLSKTLNVHLVEISPHLKAKQQATLVAHGNISWHTSLADVDLSQPTVLLANELLDALPVHQYFLKNGQYFERLVTTACSGFEFTYATEPTDTGHDGLLSDAPATITIYPAGDALLADIRTRLNGYALFVDYGGSGHADTLQAQRHHKMVDPLAYAGESDLTTHVDFGHVHAILGTGASTAMDMGPFLLALGLASRATILMERAPDDETRAQIATVTQKLVDPNKMGSHFKCLACRSSGLDIPAGFLD
ncbi:MAG: class I SAM-dependent methyltransferase [Proteobacteria bacterium]|nr:class I SAM-dependent methyltransferase [Pseudomonadota bacterium]